MWLILPRFSDTILIWRPKRLSIPLMTSLTSSILSSWRTRDFLLEGWAIRISASEADSKLGWQSESSLADNWLSLTLTWASCVSFSKSWIAAMISASLPLNFLSIMSILRMRWWTALSRFSTRCNFVSIVERTTSNILTISAALEKRGQCLGQSCTVLIYMIIAAHQLSTLHEFRWIAPFLRLDQEIALVLKKTFRHIFRFCGMRKIWSQHRRSLRIITRIIIVIYPENNGNCGAT